MFGTSPPEPRTTLQQATALAQRMVERLGMSERIGPVALSAPSSFLERGAALDGDRRPLLAMEPPSGVTAVSAPRSPAAGDG